ncbi:MAG: 4-hydroxy-tetrahydrodipicolinate reductase [Syntrophomonadaceae bacterium]|jgi:4-hydroxy-tetrahydrodipicolinate reductase
MKEKIKVVVAGALGKMGIESMQAIAADNELELSGAIDIKAQGETAASLTGLKSIDLPIENNLEQLISRIKPDILLDFTNPQAVFNNARLGLKNNISCVIGTTGLNEIELKQLDSLAQENNVGIAVIPNFAIGAVLMMKFAAEAARYLPDVEIIELHHDRKIDSPSGTAIKTAEMISHNRPPRPPANFSDYEKVAGCRGGDVEQIRIHSVRLPGFVAHQEVIFGGMGQSLTIRHDSFDRVGFMPGVVMVIKKMMSIKGLVYGMENFL